METPLLHPLRELVQAAAERAIVNTVSDTDDEATDQPRIHLLFDNRFEGERLTQLRRDPVHCRVIQLAGADDLDALAAIPLLMLKPGGSKNLRQNGEPVMSGQHSKKVGEERCRQRRHNSIDQRHTPVPVQKAGGQQAVEIRMNFQDVCHERLKLIKNGIDVTPGRVQK